MRRLIALLTILLLASCTEPVDPTDSVFDPDPTNTPAGECTNESAFVSGPATPVEVAPGETVSVTWTFENTGTCEWDEYQLAQIGGGFLSLENDPLILPRNVDPGRQIEITARLTLNEIAPSGVQQEAVVRLRTAEGDLFGESGFVLANVPGNQVEEVTPIGPTPTP